MISVLATSASARCANSSLATSTRRAVRRLAAVPEWEGEASRVRPVQHLRRRDVLHQLGPAEEESRQRLALAEELRGLVVPMTALLVVALAEGEDRVRLGR